MTTTEGGGMIRSIATSNRKRKAPTGPGCGGAAAPSTPDAWTEEMHRSFLDRMEAAFVHDILFGTSTAAAAAAAEAGGHPPPPPHHHRCHAAANHGRQSTPTSTAPKLDRYVPDLAESTHGGHGCKGAPAAPGPGIKRRRPGTSLIGWNGCVATVMVDGTSTRNHPLSGPPKQHSGNDDDQDEADQVVPLFEVAETAGSHAAGNNRRSMDVLK